MASSEERNPAEDSGDITSHDGIDMATFSQILEMDEPGDTEFSYSIVCGFLEQARETFVSIEEALQEEDLVKLSSLGHFLKGSSATLGLIKIRDGCEKIQRYGKMENLDGSALPDQGLCLKRTRDAFEQVKYDFEEVEVVLLAYYEKLDGNSTDNA